jgi:putative hydrolase of the HAD superfamily
MQRYKHIYLDLDRTLWDFKVNSTETLRDLFYKYSLDNDFASFDLFYKSFEKHNHELWAQYLAGSMKKSILRNRRFYLTLGESGIYDDSLSEKLGNDYIALSPTKTGLLPYTIEALDYLRARYSLYIITNGFNEVQFAKIRNSGLEKYFRKIFTSDSTGYLKPRKEIFNYAITSVNAKKKECIMIGDDLVNDIIGAKNAGIDQVYFNPERSEHKEKPSFEISSLLELTEIF